MKDETIGWSVSWLIGVMRSGEKGKKLPPHNNNSQIVITSSNKIKSCTDRRKVNHRRNCFGEVAKWLRAVATSGLCKKANDFHLIIVSTTNTRNATHKTPTSQRRRTAGRKNPSTTCCNRLPSTDTFLGTLSGMIKFYRQHSITDIMSGIPTWKTPMKWKHSLIYLFMFRP